MKKLNEQFKQILDSRCLTSKEKEHLVNLFRNFMNRRELISRSVLETKEEPKEWTLDQITD